MSSSRDKWTKHRRMATSSTLDAALPATQRLTKENFRRFAEQYGRVIVKPRSGSGGSGVISVSHEGGDGWQLHYGAKRRTYSGIDSAYKHLRRLTGKSSCLVQRKISLARVKGRPFDVRVMLQRSKRSGWVQTGKLAKIAGPGYIVTNVARSRGRVVPVNTAIRRSDIQGSSSSRINASLNHLSHRSAEVLQRYYKIRTVGMDMGIDRHGKVWIIEANFRPSKSLFAKLKDKSMYKRIISFSRD